MTHSGLGLDFFFERSIPFIISALFCSMIWSSVNSIVPFTSPLVCATSGEEGWTGLSVPLGSGEVGGDFALGDLGLPRVNLKFAMSFITTSYVTWGNIDLLWLFRANKAISHKLNNREVNYYFFRNASLVLMWNVTNDGTKKMVLVRCILFVWTTRTTASISLVWPSNNSNS